MVRRQKDTAQLRRIAQEKFGYDRLHPGQREAIQSVLDGCDTLAVMPTGSGKSAIYQMAGLLKEGATVVVSPLIALQRDQVESINALELGGAALVNSTLKDSERQAVFEQLRQGELEFIFLAPEQFERDDTLAALHDSDISLFVVDEAHCISEWGHDFRPDYLKLGSIAAQLGKPTLLALTATAAPPVREEIVTRLRMRDPRVIVHGFDRPNIWLTVRKFDDEADKRAALVEQVVQAAKPGIIYAATRKRAEEVAAALIEAGVGAVAYHAGLKAKQRDMIQSEFMNDQHEVIVATTAFGMGIDKPNVRFVYHYDISDSVDSYYQEIGRAGRDGQPAEAILFYCQKDLGIRRFFAGSGQLDVDELEQIIRALRRRRTPVTLGQLRDAFDLSESRLTLILSRLSEVGLISVSPEGTVQATEQRDDVAVALEAATVAQAGRKQFEQSRLEMVRGYAEVRDCRREYLLNYFGESLSEPCGHCDNCAAGITVVEQSTDQPYPLNSRVLHDSWGAGLVLRYEGDKMVILFDKVGYKTLATDFVQQNGLLAAA